MHRFARALTGLSFALRASGLIRARERPFALIGLPSALLFAAYAGVAAAQERIVFATDWLAQAEHGGFYQAVAEGTYRKHGLDVTIKMGGPQVNGMQLLAAGQLDVAMADGLQVLSAVENGVPLTAIAATFQKNPTVIIAHPGVDKLESLKGKPIAIAAAANTTFWPWLKQKYGFTDAQKRPYGFSVQPFLADPNLSQQGFATSAPFSIEKAGVQPKVFLLADLGNHQFDVRVTTPRDMDQATFWVAFREPAARAEDQPRVVLERRGCRIDAERSVHDGGQRVTLLRAAC